MTMDKIDKTFCQDYLDYLMTEYRPKGKRVELYTPRLLPYPERSFECSRACEIIKVNPFTKINNSDKIRLPGVNGRI